MTTGQKVLLGVGVAAGAYLLLGTRSAATASAPTAGTTAGGNTNVPVGNTSPTQVLTGTGSTIAGAGNALGSLLGGIGSLFGSSSLNTSGSGSVSGSGYPNVVPDSSGTTITQDNAGSGYQDVISNPTTVGSTLTADSSNGEDGTDLSGLFS